MKTFSREDYSENFIFIGELIAAPTFVEDEENRILAKFRLRGIHDDNIGIIAFQENARALQNIEVGSILRAEGPLSISHGATKNKEKEDTCWYELTARSLTHVS